LKNSIATIKPLSFSKLKKRPLESFFLSIVLLETFLMGSGRMLEFGPITVKMLLSSIAVGYSIFLLIWGRRIQKEIVFLTLFFFLPLSISSMLGIINNADINLIIEDIKPLSFFIMGVFFWLTINSYKRINLVIRLIKFSSFVLAALYLTILLLLITKIIDFNFFYSIMDNINDVGFRDSESWGNPFFIYKGFLYMCIGFIFYFLERGVKEKAIALLIFIAIVLTLTRGFLLALAMTFFIYLLVFYRITYRRLIYIIIFCLMLAIIIPLTINSYINAFGDKLDSDMVRVVIAQQVYDAITPISILIGHGFGIGIPEKMVHMEVSYFEIFHKQGLLGLFFWLLILFLLFYKYYKAILYGKRDIALPFLLSSLFIYFQTLTNPFLNNPIGMSMILISFTVLNFLGKADIKLKKSI
jgi:hypothetical protein